MAADWKSSKFQSSRSRVRAIGLALLALTLSALTALSLPASASAVGTSVLDAGNEGRYASLAELGSDSLAELGIGAMTTQATSPVISAGSCKYTQDADDAHVSTQTGTDASTHGHWDKHSGTCPTYAQVEIFLQAAYCDNSGCRWVTLTSNSQKRKAKNLGGRRVNARWACLGTRTVGYRSYVDVDLHGVIDPSGKTYSTPKDLRCNPA